MISRRQRHTKASPRDWVCLVDEQAAPDERASSMLKLCADGHLEKLVPVAEEWLRHHQPLLRHKAMQVLMIWQESARHLPKVFEKLHHDPTWWVRAGAASLLVGDWILRDDNRDEILSHLVHQLEVDDDEDAQMAIYEDLLKAIIPDRSQRPELPDEAHGWDRARDVDWSLLAPWRRQDPSVSP